MTDPFDVPDRPLPPAVRAAAHERIRAGIQWPGTGRRRSYRAPIAVAAAVAVLTAGAVVVAGGVFGSGKDTAPAGTGVQQRRNSAMVQYQGVLGSAPQDEVDRCGRLATATHPPRAQWQPLVTVEANRVRAIAFRTPAGPVFCELTPAAVTLSQPASAPPAKGATLTFHTKHGTMGGLAAPEVKYLFLERPTELRGAQPVVVDGIFLVPNQLLASPAGLILRANDSRTADIVPVKTLPPLTPSVVDQPQPPAERTSPDGQRLGSCLAKADAQPAADPDAWTPGPYVELTETDKLQLGRYGNLLAYCRLGDTQNQELNVMNLDRVKGPWWLVSPAGTIRAGRIFYDLKDGSSDTITWLGLIDKDDVASITLTSPGFPEAKATVVNRTFVLAGPALADTKREHIDQMRVTVRNTAGAVLEDIPYRKLSG